MIERHTVLNADLAAYHSFQKLEPLKTTLTLAKAKEILKKEKSLGLYDLENYVH